MCPACGRNRCVCIPEGFWSSSRMLRAAGERDLRTLFRELNNRGLSQRTLAALTGLGQTTVGAIMKGRRALTSNHLIDQALAGLRPPAPNPPADHAAHGAADLAEPAAGAPDHDPLAALGRHSAGLVRHADAGPVGSRSMTLADERLRDLAERYLADPATDILSALAELSAQLEAWRGQKVPLTVARSLWVLSGWRSALASWMSVDATRPGDALAHARAAQVAAEESGHDGITVWALICRRNISYWQRNRSRAAQYAEQAWQRAQAVGGGAAVISASALAQDLAVRGSGDRAKSLIRQARRALESKPTQDSDLGGPLSCGLPRASGYWSEAFLDLGDHPSAVRCAREGLEASRESLVRAPGPERMLTVHLAMGLAASGRVDEAVAAVDPLLTLAPSLRVRPLVLRLERLGRLLPAGEATAAVRERIRAFADL